MWINTYCKWCLDTSKNKYKNQNNENKWNDNKLHIIKLESSLNKKMEIIFFSESKK